ncbi:MAG TPA: bile acid:sodium symporter, partial [Aggregicoccus sp.]|nr:bile acid:sodium symporter [Aggregicoccus sp.]
MRERTLPLLHAARRLARDWFLLGMLAAVALAALFPELGRTGGPLHADLLADAGIFLVFFLHGLALAPRALRAGAGNWRLHLLVQAFTFGVFPLLWLLTDALVGRWLPPQLSLGFLYLCAVPSTISSSVALTGAARGNVA